MILNLAVWFALHTLFGTVKNISFWGMRFGVPVLSTVDPALLILAVVAMAAVFRLKWGMIPTLAGSAALGIVYRLAVGFMK